MALWKGWLAVILGMGVLAGEIHAFLGEEDQSDNDESISAQSAIPPASSPSSYEDAPSYFDSEPLPEDNSHHPQPSPPKEAQLEGRQVQPQGQEESGIMVLLAICVASFFSVYVIYSLFGKKKERRRGTELKTYSRSTAS